MYEAFDKATPNRKYRIAAAGVGVAISAITGGVAVASITGQYENPDVLLFGNSFLTLAVDALVGGTSAWAAPAGSHSSKGANSLPGSMYHVFSSGSHLAPFDLARLRCMYGTLRSTRSVALTEYLS